MSIEQRESHRATRFNLTPEPCSYGLFKGYARLDRINSTARSNPDQKFKALVQQFTIENLRQAFLSLDGSKAVGIDQITKNHYPKNLETNLKLLANRISRRGWRAQPSREVLIPKANGATRPLANRCLEDKIDQQLGAKILEAIYDDSFHRHSFRFRPKRNTHQAIARFYNVIQERIEHCVVVEMDLEKFFNSMDHEKLLEILSARIEDSHFLRLIRRMLRNSILTEDGEIRQNERGTPQGAPISPILANIYLDAVFVFTDRSTAEEFKLNLAVHFESFKLKMNDDKSGILNFNSHSPEAEIQFLGFHFYWGKKSWNSSYSYYGLIFNRSKLSYFYYAIMGTLFKWLNRRSQKRSYPWGGFAKRLMYKPLPKPSEAALIDITSGIVPELKRKMRSRMRKSRTYGSKRSPGLSPVFT